MAEKNEVACALSEKKQSVLKDTLHDSSNYEDPTTSFGDYSFIMWENTSNMCWLDASMAILAHNNTIRRVCNRPDAQVSKIIKSYDEAMKTLNNFNSDQNTEDRLKTARGILQSVQDSSLKYLQPLLKFKKGEPESAHHSLLSLIKEDKVIQDYFNVTYAWIRSCENCDVTRVVVCKKPIITISNVTNFEPEEQFSPINCQHCNKKDQKMKLVYKKMPPCLIFHFENGAGVGNNIHLKFKVASREYQLTAIMMLEKGQESNVNHFVTYIRDPVNEKWLECNDLDMDITSFTSDPPLEILPDRLSLKDIYIYVFEAFDDLGTVKIAEDPSLTDSSHSIPCIELSDGDDDNSSSHESSIQNKEETKGSGGETVEKIQAFLSASLKEEDSKSHSSVSDQNKNTTKDFSVKNDNHKCNESFMDQLFNLPNKMGNNPSLFIENKDMEEQENNLSFTTGCNHPGENTLTFTKKLDTQQNDTLATPVSNGIDFEDYIKKRLFEYSSKLAVPLTKTQAKDLSMSKASNEPGKQIMVQGKQHMNGLNIAMISHDKTQMSKNDLAHFFSKNYISDSQKVISVLTKESAVSVFSKIEENNRNSVDLMGQEPPNKTSVTDRTPNKNCEIFDRNDGSHKLKKLKKVSFNEKLSVKKSSVSIKGSTKQDKISKQEKIVDKKSKRLQKDGVKSSTFDGIKKCKSKDIKNISKQQKQMLKPEVKKEDLKISRSMEMDFLKIKKFDDNNDDGADMTVQNLVIPNLQLAKKKNESEIPSTKECKLVKSVVNCIRKKQLDAETKLETVNDVLFEKCDKPTYRENKMVTQKEEKSDANYEKNNRMSQKSSLESKNNTKMSATEDSSINDVVSEMQQPSCSYNLISNYKVKMESCKNSPLKVKFKSHKISSPANNKLESHKITSPAKANNNLKRTGKINKKRKGKTHCSRASSLNDTDFLNSENNKNLKEFCSQTSIKVKNKKKIYSSDDESSLSESSPGCKKAKTEILNHSNDASPAVEHTTSDISPNEHAEKVPLCPNPNCPCAEASSEIILDGTIDYFLSQIFETFLYKREL